MNIYFICTGNTCRSPMAAAILAHKNSPNIAVKSAGIYATQGQEMSVHAKQVLAEEQIAAAHHSSPVNTADVEWADLILTMTERQKDVMTQMYPTSASKIYTLNEYVDGQMADVVDPYGADVAVYRQTYQQLTDALNKLFVQLKRGD